MATFCVHGIVLSDECEACVPTWSPASGRHDPNIWTKDRRPIVEIGFEGADGIERFLASSGWDFQRFERSGEMASIPYIRASRDGRDVEFALRSVSWIAFDEVAP